MAFRPVDDPDSSLLSSVPSSPPSSPLSSLSRTPTPPFDMPFPARSAYPSPPASQQTSQSGSPVPDGMDATVNSDIQDGPPPPKRRRISKELPTEYLDMRSQHIRPEQQPQLDTLLRVLHKRQKIVVIAGAGISVSAGIPDFRSSQGLFRSLKEEYNLKGSGKHLFDASVYKDDVSTSSFHDMVSTMSRATKGADPTAFHHMLATIAQENRLLRLYTQNVDGIDTSLEPLRTSVPLRKEEGKWPRTVQLHGGLDKMICSKCQDTSDLDPALFTGPVPPLCPKCEEVNDIRTNIENKRSHGIGKLRPRMVLYNEHNPDDEAIGAVTKEDLRKRPDAVVVVGTTLKVPGVRRIVREMCATVRDRRDGVTIWINNDPPPVSKDLEGCWNIIVQGPSDEVAKHAAMRKWHEPSSTGEYREVTDEAAAKAARESVQVQLPVNCGVEHLTPTTLPSEAHKNNSFKPPLSFEKTPLKISERGPTDWSPISTPQHPSVIPSIENGSSVDGNSENLEDFIALTTMQSGLLTPSKSQRNSPTGKALTTKLTLTVGPMPKNAPKSKPAAKKSTKKEPANDKKRKNVRYVKPHPSTKKAAGKTKTQTGAGITKSKVTDAFKSSKSVSTTAKLGMAGKDDFPSPMTSPSKLRQVTNMSSEPMHPLSPQDPRNNASPTVSEDGQIAVEANSSKRRHSRVHISSMLS